MLSQNHTTVWNMKCIHCTWNYVHAVCDRLSFLIRVIYIFEYLWSIISNFNDVKRKEIFLTGFQFIFQPAEFWHWVGRSTFNNVLPLVVGLKVGILREILTAKTQPVGLKEIMELERLYKVQTQIVHYNYNYMLKRIQWFKCQY